VFLASTRSEVMDLTRLPVLRLAAASVPWRFSYTLGGLVKAGAVLPGSLRALPCVDGRSFRAHSSHSVAGASAVAAIALGVARRSRHAVFCSRQQIRRHGVAAVDVSTYTIEGHGYALAAASDGTGGWLAHRADVNKPGSGPGDDWVLETFADPNGTIGTDLSGAANFVVPGAQLTHRPRILVLYGSLREASFSRKMAHECSRLLEALGADVRTFSPVGLPVRDPNLESHPKVQELRSLSLWSEGHVWVSPEMHGAPTGVFKNQIDWLPLNTGSVRPTQGRTCVVLQVNGGSQSFNVVNELRRLARWMRMPCCTNQSSVAKAWQEFDDLGRMKPSDFRDRVVDVMEEYYKFTLIMREQAFFLNDRYSERKEVAAKGRLLTQAEKETELKDEAAAEAVVASASGKTQTK